MAAHGFAWIGCPGTCRFLYGDLVSNAALAKNYLFFDFLCLGFYILRIAGFVLNAAGITGLLGKLAQEFFS